MSYEDWFKTEYAIVIFVIGMVFLAIFCSYSELKFLNDSEATCQSKAMAFLSYDSKKKTVLCSDYYSNEVYTFGVISKVKE